MNTLEVFWESHATSANRRLGHGVRRDYPDPDYASSVDDLTWSIREKMGWCPPWPYPIKGPVRVDLIIHTRRMDIDALVKPILDCLEKAGAIQNDNQVVELHVSKMLMPADRPKWMNCCLMIRLEAVCVD